MINRKQMEHDIMNHQQLEVVLPQVLNMISSDYYGYSALQFTMNYYNYYEMSTQCAMPEIDEKFRMLDAIAKNTIFASFDGAKREVAIGQIDTLRNEIIDIMQSLTELTDEFAIYEYVLNRLEKNYEEEMIDVDNDTVTKDIMQSIFSDQDQMLINTRIRSMLSQLPIRMTKQKFFDMLRDSLSIYEGSDISSVRDYLYMIRCAAGLLGSKMKATDKPHNASLQELYAYHKQLESLDVTALSQEEFQKAQGVLSLAVEKIQSATDRYFSLQELVNAFYCMLLNQPYASMEVDQEVAALKVITEAISTAISAQSKESVEDEIADLFECTEGKLERYIQFLSKDESLLESIENFDRDLIASLMLDHQLSSLSLSKLLTSNSVFIDLNTQSEDGKADRAKLDQIYEELVMEFTKALERKNKLYNRAIIAATLREMPVLFGSMEEVRDYIKNSLSGCHDIAEKLASIELFFAAIE